MTVEQTKIVVKPQKFSASAERKSAGRTTPICSEEQPGVFRHVKRTINGGQRSGPSNDDPLISELFFQG
jgi:hypothetical protein